MAKDDQRGLEGKGGATAKQYAICEVAKAQGAATEKNGKKCSYNLTMCFCVFLRLCINKQAIKDNWPHSVKGLQLKRD